MKNKTARALLAAATAFLIYIGMRENALGALDALGVTCAPLVQVLCIAGWLALCLSLGTTPADYAGWRRAEAYKIAVAPFVGAALQFALAWLLSYLPIEESAQTMQFWETLLSAVLLAPVLEESVFRGIIFDRFGDAVPLPLAVLFSSLLFASLHTGAGAMLASLVAGALFALTCYGSGSVIPAVLSHAGFNLVGVLAPNLGDGTLIAVGAVCTVLAAAGTVLLMKKERQDTTDDTL